MKETVKKVYTEGQEKLAGAGIHDAVFDARALLSFVMDVPFREIPLRYTDEVTDEQQARYKELLEKRIGGEPLQYITGEQEFMGLPFHVDSRVLIPRLDTEVLAEMAVNYADELKPPVRVLDLCCGSGAIGLSIAVLAGRGKSAVESSAAALAHEGNNKSAIGDEAGTVQDTGLEVVLSDISRDALDVANENAKALGVLGKVTFVKGDLFENVGRDSDQNVESGFDLIVCNPPYIRTDVIDTLDAEVKDHEPMLALDGGADGLDIYRRIAEEAPDYLKPGGCLMMEIGCDQAEDVKRLLAARFDDVQVVKDLAGLDRVIIAK